MGTESKKFTFYSVTSADRSVTETAVHTDILGFFQLSRERKIESQGASSIEKIYLFIPSTYLTGLNEQMKVSDGTDDYAIDYIEDYDTTQEIYMRKIP